MLNSCKVRRNTLTREIDQVVIDRPFTDERANVIYNYYRSVGIPIHLGKQVMQQELLRRGYNLDFTQLNETVQQTSNNIQETEGELGTDTQVSQLPTNEGQLQFLSTPQGEVYGFVTPEGEMFLDPDIAGVNTLIHEGAHIQYKVLKTAAERGDVKAQAILNKIQELTNPVVETIFNAKKSQVRVSDEVSSVDMQSRRRDTRKLAVFTKRHLERGNLQKAKEALENYTGRTLPLSPTFEELENIVTEIESREELDNLPYNLIEEDYGVSKEDIREVFDLYAKKYDKEVASNNINFQISQQPSPIFDSEGNLNIEELNRIVENNLITTNLTENEKEGLRRASKYALGLFIISREAEKKRATDGQELVEETTRRAIEDYSRAQQKIWSQERINQNYDYFSEGSEAVVYKSKDGTHVLKQKNVEEIELTYTPTDFIKNRVILYNTLFPDSTYEIVGITEQGDFLLKQDFVEGKTLTELFLDEEIQTREEVLEIIDKEVKRRFEVEREDRGIYFTKDYIIADISEYNIVQTTDGRFIIDAITVTNNQNRVPLSIEIEQDLDFQIIGEQTTQERTTISPEVLSSPVYNQRENETDAQYKERLKEEVFARALGDNAEQYLKDLGFTTQEAKTFLQKVQEFLAEIVDWLRGKKGFQDLSVDEINKLSIREFLDRSTTSMMLGEFKTQTRIVEDNISFQIIDQQRATPEELQRLRIAKELQRRGVSNSGIWVTTGWEFDTIQNRWVQEVQNELSLKVDPTQIGEYTLENFIEHPELFERLPELKEINIKINTDESFQTVAEFDGKTTITINRNLLQRAMGDILTSVPTTSAEQIVSHEIQHVIAGILNFEGGSSPLGISVTIGFIKRGYPATEGRFARISEYVQERFGEDWKNTATSEELEAFSEELYQKSAGEIEAFNTQDRAGLLQTDRTFTAPSETQRFDTGYLLDTSDSIQALLTTDIHGTQEYVPANSIITYYSEIGEINYKRNSKGDLVTLKTVSSAPQQEESITYQQLLSIPNLSKEQALEAYKNLYSTKFYDWSNKTNEC